MPLIKWRESYSVGSDEIDNEHKKLVELVNELFFMVRDHKHINESVVCLDKLTRYTQEHFEHEEQIMEEVDFPSIHEHKAIHASLLSKVNIFKRRIDDQEEMVTEELYLFLREWLLTHILEEDMKYKMHVQPAMAA